MQERNSEKEAAAEAAAEAADTATADREAADAAPETEPEVVPETEPEVAPGAELEVAPETEPAGREAAKYRRRLREVEVERDSLAERLTVAQQREVERHTRLRTPSALWALGASVTDALDDDGNVDPAKAAALGQRYAEQYGLQPPRGCYAPLEGMHPGDGGSAAARPEDIVMGRG